MQGRLEWVKVLKRGVLEVGFCYTGLVAIRVVQMEHPLLVIRLWLECSFAFIHVHAVGKSLRRTCR